MTVAHAFGAAGFHVEFLLVGAGVAIVGVWMLRTGADARGGGVMVGIGVLLGLASLLA